ncbi:hypothetical protein GCM10023264_18430 [Sphingomonas daechungensis]|uniref:Uncharacterized protein n=1 Tax=Sphingomonas daechungensis TaxID=1176646 RepID=A0ABX6T2I4_9SPHN|nr:hypothetical protein [Sphingomonas daechungensis]QNP43990.1 hypothetical protein H9L15_05175 [Sphingomonas daechungensis]
MKHRSDAATRQPQNQPPQPLAGPGEQRPQQFDEEDEADAFIRWLAHGEAGRLGEPNYVQLR